MRKIFKSLLILSVVFFSLPYAAMADSYPEKVLQKLENGAANAVTGFMEIPKTVMVTSRSDGPLYAMTIGLAAGILHMVGRTLYGAVDMATFMIPTKSLVDPDYIWNDTGKITSYNAKVEMR